MIWLVIAVALVFAVFLLLILLELKAIRMAMGAATVLMYRGLPAFDDEVKTLAKRSLFESSLKFPQCD